MSSKPAYNYFNNDLAQDIANNNIIPENRQPNAPIKESETAFESKLRRISDKTMNNHLVSGKNMSKFKESLTVSGILDKEYENNITVRELPIISQEIYDKFRNSITDNENLGKLYTDLSKINCNYKSVECNNSIGGITPLTFLIENSYSMSANRAKEINDKYNIFKKYIYNYRTVNADGNCFYRAVMFRYLEILVLNNQIEYLQNITYDVYNSFNSEELKSRLVIGNISLKPDLALKLLILITDLLKKGKIILAHNMLVKSFSCCRKFDYAIIFYFRYILYDYIKKNEEKTYIKSFPIKLGNLLPSQYETKEGKFLYESFYQNYQLKFYTDAEKIVIYLTPFVLGVALNILIYDANDDEILQNFKWEEGHGLNLADEINLLNRKNHYEIVYTSKEYEKYKNIFSFYENNIKSVILSDINKYLKPKENDKNFDMLTESFDVKPMINNPKTMVIKTNNINRNAPNLNQAGNNKINNKQIIDINKIDNPNNNAIKANTNIENKNNLNNFNNINNNRNDEDLNPKRQIIKQNNNNNNIKNGDNGNINNNLFLQSQSQYINKIKDNINNYKQKNANMKNNNLVNGINNNNNKTNYSPQINNNAYGLQTNINGNTQAFPQAYNIKNNTQQYNGNNYYTSQSYVPSANTLQKAQNFTTVQPHQPLEQKINGINNDIYQNIKVSESNHSNNNNNSNNNIIYNMNNNTNNFSNANNNYIQSQKNNTNNIPPKKVPEIGLKTPGNESAKSSNNNTVPKLSLICTNCKNPINNQNIPLCKNCFKNEIINESYFSYLSVLNQKRPPEEAIFANINLMNIKKQKINLNLDNAINEYNKLFPGVNLDRKSIVLELKKKICIYCTNEIKNNSFIELPCKCRICSVEHLNNYLSFYKKYEMPFTCRCKINYYPNMMFQLGIIKLLNNSNLTMIRNYFQKRLNSCCCICAKSSNIAGKSNTIICLENQENNIFLHQLVHFFCGNCCRKFQNSEFNCHICHMKHFWNSN